MKATQRWFSDRLGQEITVARWGTFGQPVLVFPSAGGDAEEIERFGLIDACAPLLAAAAGAGERAQKFRDALVGAIPMKRVGQPDDIPGAVCFLASDDAAFVTGQALVVDGGLYKIS